MGSQPSIPEEKNTELSESQAANLNLKSILKGKSPQHSDLSAAVSETDIIPPHARRLSRRASIAPPQLDEAKVDEIIKEEVAENSALDDSDANLAVPTNSSVSDSVGNNVVTSQNETETEEQVVTNPENEISENVPVDNISETQTQEPLTSKEALLWAPVLASNETSPNTIPSNIQPIKVASNKHIVSQINKRVSGLFKKEENISVDTIIRNLLGHRGKKVQRRAVDIPRSHIEWVCRNCLEVVMNQPTLLEITGPVNVCGDVHGQYDDLIRVFEMCGYPPNANYLFLGDYVDRGKQSLETILLLMCFKIKYPENFFILRGNHECASVNKVYGFFDECKRRTNVKVWKTFTNFFNCLPIAALISDKIFCVHGGLSPELRHFDQIRQLRRPCDVPSSGLLNDLLWSDPSESIEEWAENDRGVSYYFGKNAVDSFLETFSMDLVCRAHMVVEDGYEFFNNRRLVTVFSAPNYCGEFDNKGAIMTVDEKLMCSFKILEPLYPNAVLPLAREPTILPPSNY